MERTKSKKTKTRRVLVSIVLGGLLLILIGIIVYVAKTISKAPDISEVNITQPIKANSIIYDVLGEKIDEFSAADNRSYIGIEEIPTSVIQAVITIEDSRFYEHHGIDIRKILGAVVNNFSSGSLSDGASTITQQVIKNAVALEGNSLEKKIQEQYLAIKFEQLYSKDTILEYYLNSMGFGTNIVGIEAAANQYYGKSASELSLVEGATLAVLMERPTYYSLYTHPENNWEKVKQVLEQMEKAGYLTAEEKEQALLEKPYERLGEGLQQLLEGAPKEAIQSYFVDALYKQILEDLQTVYNISEIEAKAKIYSDGLQIESTLDSRVQSIVEKYMADESNYPESLYKIQVEYSIAGVKANGTMFDKKVQSIILNSQEDIPAFKEKQLEKWHIGQGDTIVSENLITMPQPQSAFVVTDYKTGAVKALYGGRGEKYYHGFNYATQAKRMPGSTFKVLAAYAPALNEGKITPDTVISNEKVSFTIEEGGSWTPLNWNGQYQGSYTITQAIANSMNVIAAKVLVEQVGIDKSFEYLKEFGFTTLREEDKTYALSMGGLTDGVTPLELTAAYATIANEGTYLAPSFYTVVKDREGNILLDRTQGELQNSHQVLSQEAAGQLTTMLCEVVDGPSAHTGGKIRNHFKQMPIAGKTGTASNNTDLLFVGYTPYYAATIWTGYSNPDAVQRSNNYHLDLWAKIMNEIHQGEEIKKF